MDDPKVRELLVRLKAVRLEASTILAEIERTIDDGTGARQVDDEPIENTAICSGDRIRIKNKVKNRLIGTTALNEWRNDAQR